MHLQLLMNRIIVVLMVDMAKQNLFVFTAAESNGWRVSMF